MKTTYIFQEYPKALYRNGAYTAVSDADQESAMRSEGWTDYITDREQRADVGLVAKPTMASAVYIDVPGTKVLEGYTFTTDGDGLIKTVTDSNGRTEDVSAAAPAAIPSKAEKEQKPPSVTYERDGLIPAVSLSDGRDEAPPRRKPGPKPKAKQ